MDGAKTANHTNSTAQAWVMAIKLEYSHLRAFALLQGEVITKCPHNGSLHTPALYDK